MSARDVLRHLLSSLVGLILAGFGGLLLYLDTKDGTPTGIGSAVGGALMLAGGVLIDPAKVREIVQAVKGAKADLGSPPSDA